MSTRILRRSFPILILALCLAACSNQENIPASSEPMKAPNTQTEGGISPLAQISLTLPEGVSGAKVADTQRIDFMKADQRIGGILVLDCDPAIFEDAAGSVTALEETVNKALDQLGLPAAEWQMSGSSECAFQEYSRGTETSEYTTYVLRGIRATYAVWFDEKQVSDSLEDDILAGIHSDDIVDSLNQISDEAFMDAISGE